MEAQIEDCKAQIFYYFREKQYNSMLNLSKEAIAQFKSDISFQLFYALALLLNNRLEESINELDSIKLENDVKLASTITLMYAHKLLGVSNKDLFSKLDSQMRDLRKNAEAVDFYHSGFVLFVLNKPEKAVDYLDKALSIDSDLARASVLKGWILLQLKKTGSKVVGHNLTDLFESGLKTANNTSRRNLDASLGLAESYLVQNKPDEAVNTVNKAIVRFPDSQLPLIMKMKIQFALQDWEQTIETMNRIAATNTADKIDLEALKMNIVLLLCRDANYPEAALCIQRYVDVLNKAESKNGRLLLHNARLFSKVCAKNSQILKGTIKITERAVQTDPQNVDFVVELGRQFLSMGRLKEAQKYYKTATRINENSLNALMGLTVCELEENGLSEQVKKQVEYLLELEQASTSAHLYLIQAKIADKPEEALDFLKKACDVRLASIKHRPYSDEYLLMLDPDFMLDVCKEFLRYIPSNTEHEKKAGSKNNEFIEAIENVLKIITKACPGLSEALYLLAKLQFFNGESANSMNTLELILNRVDEEMSSDVFLLMSQIHVQGGFYERAAQSLEMALSHDFKIRENPVYHLVRGLVDKNTNNVQDAIKSLTMALNLISTSSDKNRKQQKEETALNYIDVSLLTQKATIYIELIEVHNLIGQTDEAAKLLEDAVKELNGTPEESRILILSADHAIKRNNIQTAIDLLSKVKPEETYYLQAGTKLADILLNHRLDKYAHLECYQNMVADNPTSETYDLLGDAYMKILEPDEALECYNKALAHSPKDSRLTKKMGRALVETHYFQKAVNFYKEAVKSPQNSHLKLELAELYFQLKQYDKAEVLLMTDFENESSVKLEDLTYLQYRTKLLVLLARTQEKSGKMKSALNTLKDARDNQTRVKKRLMLEQTSVPEEDIKLLIEIGMKLADISIALKNNNEAIQYYKDAIDVSPNDLDLLSSLAKLYMQINQLDPCQQICSNILKLDPDHEAASVMMADIAFRKIDFDMALFHFTQLIIKQPTNWTALVRLVEIMRRTGNLDEAPEYLTNAERHCSGNKEAGLSYCTGLYQWYSGNLNGALRSFNAARSDVEHGQMALYNMIEICLNPDDEMLGDQFVDGDDTEYRDSRSMALKTADRLLKELKQRLDANSEDIFRYRLLTNFRLLASQEKHHIERALEDFISIASQNAYKDHVGPILGMASAYTLLKQSQRAKNQLKRVAKAQWTFEDAEHLERCWLLLADHYIQSSKYDVAADLLNRVILHNKTCCKAYEYLGFIAEKEQHYKEAVTSYECAWRFGGKTYATVGYKLAYNLMKCKNFAEAIDVGQHVLKLNPEYPRIKKDVLDKSMNNLRI